MAETAGRELPAGTEQAPGTGARPQRLVFMDWLRIYGFLVVFAYHALVNHEALFAASGHPWLKSLWEHVCGWNVGISVGLFFLASGMGLMLSAGKENFSAARFYRRRFTALLIPFYLAWVFALLIGLPATAVHLTAVGHPVRNVLLTASALDGFAAVRWGWQDWYLVGEWFLGTLVFLYLAFPLLRAACRWHPQVFLALCLFVCVAADALMTRAGLAQVMVSPLSRALPFCAGMYLAEEQRRGRGMTNAVIGFGLLVLWIVFDISPKMPGIGIVQSDIRSLAIFTGAMLAEPVLARAGRRVNGAVKSIAALTYALYLVHHVILDACARLLPADGSLKRAALAVLAAAALSCGAAILLKIGAAALIRKAAR